MQNELRNKNIYAFNILKASRVDFSKNYSFLFSTLLNVESELEFGSVSPAGFAENLMTAINHSEAFPQVDRVCLVVAFPGASRLSVLSSHNSERLSSNSMDPNYFCYVSPDSSIFKTKKTDVRIYSNIENIVRVYDGSPVQRSLALLQKMGVKSGLTVPLSISNLVSGFLFLNSVKEGQFSKLNNEDWSALCLLKLVALSCLNKSLFGAHGIDSTLTETLFEAKHHGNTFSSEEFKALLSFAFTKRFNKVVRVRVLNSGPQSFLFPQTNAAYAIVKIFEGLENIPDEVVIEVQEKALGSTQCLDLRISKVSLNSEQMQALQDLKLFTAQEILQDGGDLILRSPLDLATKDDYSI